MKLCNVMFYGTIIFNGIIMIYDKLLFINKSFKKFEYTVTHSTQRRLLKEFHINTHIVTNTYSHTVHTKVLIF